MGNIQKVANELTNRVADRVDEMQEQGRLDLPDNYSAKNALKSAYLELQEVKDKNGNPVLEVASKSSIFNALLDMVTQGLNPAKDQGYFIAYGKSLQFQRSYFGSIAVLKRVTDALDVRAQVIYEGDKIDYEVDRGTYIIKSHEQNIQNKLKGKVIGAYATIIFENKADYTELMTINEIKAAWSQGNYNPDSNYDGAHENFAGEMAKKTVIQRACKKYINSSSDDHLLLSAINNEKQHEEQVEQEKEEKMGAADTIIIDDVEEEEEDFDDEEFEEEIEEDEEPPAEDLKEITIDGGADESEQIPWS